MDNALFASKSVTEEHNTGKYLNNKIAETVKQLFDLRPAAIIRQLDMRKPIYRQLSTYGHMGREDLGVAWENIDLVIRLKEYFNHGNY